jgi:hypothetical protein
MSLANACFERQMSVMGWGTEMASRDNPRARASAGAFPVTRLLLYVDGGSRRE